jgi:hypothetical protein
MKQLGLLILTVLFTSNLMYAQSKTAKVDMAFDKTVNGITAHDYGSIVYGANGKVDFNFTNKGATPLVISDVKSSCGCTTPSWSKEPIEPGKQGTITVVYNTTLPGPFNKTVVVYSNANNSPVRLEVRGKVNSQPSDLKPTTMESQQKAADMRLEEDQMQLAPVDSATKAKNAAMSKAQSAAQEEAFKKLMEEKPGDTKARKPKVITAPPVTENTTLPVTTTVESGTKKKK